jgi:hypothetical protein
MRLSPSTISFSLTLFSHGTLSFFLFTRRAEKLRMRAPRPHTYMRARDRFLRGWRRWGGRMSNYWRWFFLILPKQNKGWESRMTNCWRCSQIVAGQQLLQNVWWYCFHYTRKYCWNQYANLSVNLNNTRIPNKIKKIALQNCKIWWGYIIMQQITCRDHT